MKNKNIVIQTSIEHTIYVDGDYVCYELSSYVQGSYHLKLMDYKDDKYEDNMILDIENTKKEIIKHLKKEGYKNLIPMFKNSVKLMKKYYVYY